jgi:hypothetical protein
VNTLVTVDAKPLRPDGIQPGKATGALGFPPGTHQIAAMQKDYKPASIALQLTPSTSPTVVAYAIDVQQPGRPAARELRLFTRINRAPVGQKSYSMVYVGRAPVVNVELNGEGRALKALEEVLVPATATTITSTGKNVGEFGAEGGGHHAVILFDAHPSGLGAVVVADRVYSRAGQKH